MAELEHAHHAPAAYCDVVNFNLAEFSLSPNPQKNSPSAERPAQVRLSYEEITSVDSSAALIEMYRDKGVTFPNETRFLRHVERDWLAACEERGEKIGSKALRAPVPQLNVEVDGQNYGILGVVHTFMLGSTSLQAINRTVKRSQNWLHEQNLGTIFKIPSSVELKDHRVATEVVKDLPVFEQISAAAQMQMGLLAHVIPGPNSPLDLIPEDPRVDTQKDDNIATGDVSLFPGLKKMAAVPEEIIASSGFPTYVAIEYKQRHGIPLNHCQLRSAYMAEMLRHWDVDGDKHLLCGRAHAAEVAYFLKHPLADPMIQKLAAEHAKVLNDSPGDKNPLADLPTWNLPIYVGNVIGAAAFGYIVYQAAHLIASSGIFSHGLHLLGF